MIEFDDNMLIQIAKEAHSLSDVANALDLWKFPTVNDVYIALWELYKEKLYLLKGVCNAPISAFNALADQKSKSNTNTTKYIKNILASLYPQCYECGCSSWNDDPIPLELHHIDHDRTNNHITNVQLLCPNCHSFHQSVSRPFVYNFTDEELSDALKKFHAIAPAYRSLGVKNYQAAHYYKRAYKVAYEYDIPIKRRKQKNKGHKQGKTGEISKQKTTGKKNRKEREKASSANKISKRESIFTSTMPRDELKFLLRKFPISEIAEKYKIQISSVEFLCMQYGLPVNQQLIDLYTDDEWSDEKFIFGL